MGYRSDVGLVLTQKGVVSFRTKLASQDISADVMTEVEKLLAYAEQHRTDNGSGAELWFWSAIKWYESYSSIGFMENFLSELEDEDYRFVRVGEDFDDNEVKGIFWDNPFCMDLNRSVSFS